MAAGQVRGADAVHSPLSNKRILICHQTTLNRCARKQEKGSRDRDSPGAGAVVAQTLVLTPGCAGCRWQYKRPSSVPSLGCRARAQCRTTPRTASRAPCRSTVSVLRGLGGWGVGGGYCACVLLLGTRHQRLSQLVWCPAGSQPQTRWHTWHRYRCNLRQRRARRHTLTAHTGGSRRCMRTDTDAHAHDPHMQTPPVRPHRCARSLPPHAESSMSCGAS